MLRFIRWLTGFVRFSFCDGFSEGFINDCLACGYNISEVRYLGDTLCASCPAELYPNLRSIAKKHGGRTKIIEKNGIIFKLLPLRNRWGIFFGALAAVVIICTLTGFVWNVEVTGNERISSEEVMRLLNDNGLKEGVWKSGVDKGRLESLVMACFPDCARAHINEFGTTLRLEISEGVKKPPTVNKREYSNLKAKKDGTIIKATVYDGWAVHNKGDAVVAGDILISGVFENEKKNRFAHARGEYIARVKEPVKLKISRVQNTKHISREDSYNYLYFFGIKIPLFLIKPKGDETISDYNYVTLNEKRLPLALIKSTARHYSVQQRTLSDKELSALAKKQLDEYIKTELSASEVISKKLNYSLRDDCITVEGYILCIENIGEEVKIVK